MVIELCSYCLAQEPLISVQSIGKLCEKCVESYLLAEADKYQSRQENKEQATIVSTATDKEQKC